MKVHRSLSTSFWVYTHTHTHTHTHAHTHTDEGAQETLDELSGVYSDLEKELKDMMVCLCVYIYMYVYICVNIYVYRDRFMYI